MCCTWQTNIILEFSPKKSHEPTGAWLVSRFLLYEFIYFLHRVVLLTSVVICTCTQYHCRVCTHQSQQHGALPLLTKTFCSNCSHKDVLKLAAVIDTCNDMLMCIWIYIYIYMIAPASTPNIYWAGWLVRFSSIGSTILGVLTLLDLYCISIWSTWDLYWISAWITCIFWVWIAFFCNEYIYIYIYWISPIIHKST